MADVTLEALSDEDRTFPPPAGFVADALVTDDTMRREADADPEGFWADQARSLLHWDTDFTTTCEWDLPFAKWFTGGRLNVSYNCLDRHVADGHGDQAAILWEGEPGDTRSISYGELLAEVGRTANALKALGVERGDRVAIYMGMVPELPIAMLACARIGAAHSVVFGGFTADSLAATPSIEKCLVLRRTAQDVSMTEGRDVWWHDLVPGQSPDCPPESMDAEDLLFILYTSGTTGKPKGIMHTTGGYLTQVAFTTKYVFDLHPETDVYWCTADCGWVTGHSYIVYGPLANRATSVMYEGTPDHPGKDRFWSIVEKYGVTILYTAPTAIRTFMKWGTEFPDGHDLSSLRLLGSVGEPINPEDWIWYSEYIGGVRCPVVDTWWQTETGAIMISPLPGATVAKPGSATFPL